MPSPTHGVQRPASRPMAAGGTLAPSPVPAPAPSAGPISGPAAAPTTGPTTGPAPAPPPAGGGPTLPISVMPTGGTLTIDRITSDELLTVDGRLGLFTPLTSPDSGDPASTGNLQQIVNVLRGQIAELQSTNAALSSKLAAAEQTSTSSDDFATGVQQAVDDLQSKLAATQNPVSTFAVREFSLQAKVLVDVSPVGTIGLRFVTPGEAVEPSALSTVGLTIVPLPREAPAPQDLPTAADPAVDEIDGLTLDQLGTLRRAHVTTASTFRRAATRSSTAATLRGMLAVDRESLGRMTELAGLLAVPGIDRTSAALLHAAGIAGPATLAGSTAADLVRRYRTAARRRKGEDPAVPTTAQAQDWIDAARALTTVGAGSAGTSGSPD